VCNNKILSRSQGRGKDLHDRVLAGLCVEVHAVHLGLRRTVTLRYHSAALYQIYEHTRSLFF
jgi:hypothetical protein